MNPIFNFFIITWQSYKGIYLTLFLIIFCLIIFNKKDIATIKYIFKEIKDKKPILDPVKKQEAIQVIKTLPKDMFKGIGIWILVVIFALCVGSLLGFKYSEVKCNNFIIEEYGNTIMASISNLTEMSPQFAVSYSNVSQEYRKQKYSDENTPMNPQRELVP